MLTLFAGVCLVLIVFTLPGTYAPTIIKKKAQRKRKATGDDRWYAPIEAKKETLGEQVKVILTKPFKMLFFEDAAGYYGLYERKSSCSLSC